MNKTFLINALFLIVVNLLIKPFYIFGIDRVVQNTVGTDDYGLYNSIIGFSFLFQIISDFGVQNYNNRNIAQHRNLLGKYFPNILILKSILAVIYLLVLIPAALIFKYDISVLPMILMVGLNQVLIGLMFYMRTNISGLGLYKIDSILSTMEKILMILICGTLLYTPFFYERFQIEWFIYAQTISLLLTIATSYIIIRKHLPPIRWKFRLVYLKIIIKESYPFALILFLMTVYSKMDSVMLERILVDGKHESGIYAAAYRLLDAANMTGFLMAGLLLPMFSRMIKEKKSVLPLIRLSTSLIAVISIAVASHVWFYRNDIVMLLYKEADAYWGTILGYLLISYIPVSGNYIFGALLTANNNMMSMNRIFLISVLLNFGMNYYIIPIHKAEGAALATLITQSFVFGSLLVLSSIHFQIVFKPKILASLLAYSLAITITAYSSYHFIEGWWVLKFVISGLSAILYAFLFGMISLKTLKTLK